MDSDILFLMKDLIVVAALVTPETVQIGGEEPNERWVEEDM